MTWFADFKDICQPDAPLAGHTWYKLGGRARWLLTPRDETELIAVLKACAAAGIDWRILGRGANVLVCDSGVDAAVIKLSAPAFQAITWDNSTLSRAEQSRARKEAVDREAARLSTQPLPHGRGSDQNRCLATDSTQVNAGGGADFPALVQESVERGLAGLEGLAGIPGTIGGVIRMNAGGKYGQIADTVVAVRLMLPESTIVERRRDEIEFAYRHTDLGDAVVLGARFAFHAGDPAALKREYQRVWKEKRGNQPTLAARSAGCIFKNPPGQSAGMLLDQAGLKGTRRGQAEISTRHANFIVAHAGATASDVLELVKHAKERVLETHGVELALEIEIW